MSQIVSRASVRTMRIISPSLAGGGSERVCVNLANYWAAEGTRVELWLIHGGGEYLPLLDSKVQLRVAGTRRIRYAIGWLARMLLSEPSVPTLVLGLDLGGAVGFLKILGMVRSPVVYREGSLPEENIPKTGWWRYRFLIKQMDGVVTQTNYSARSLRKLGVAGVPMLSVANPVDPAKQVRLRESRPGERLTLLAVGRLSREKRHGLLLVTLDKLRARGIRVGLLLAGDGPLREELKNQATKAGLSDDVRFLGFAPKIEDIYPQADIFVMCSAYEGLPNALLEAVAHGCRVLSSGGGGVREILGNLGLSDCYLEETDFGENFAYKMSQVMSIPSKRWGEAAQKLATITDKAKVAGQYYQFCYGLSDNGKII